MQKPTYTDAAPDDFEAVPQNMEPNLGPLARPSDYPEAQRWRDPVPPKDCCEPVSKIFSLDPVSVNPATGDADQGPPTIEWTGSLWGVSWKTGGTPATVDFRTMDPDGLVVSPIQHPFQLDGRQPIDPSMQWANDRFAVTYSSYQEGNFVGMLNRYGYAPWGSFATHLNTYGRTVIARYTADNAWLIAGVLEDPTGNSPNSLLVAAVDDTGRRTNDPAVTIGAAVDHGAAIVGLKNRANVVWATPTGVSSRAFTWPFDDATAGAEVELPQIPAPNHGAEIAAMAFRDSVVAAIVTNDRVLTYSIDPWTDTVLSGPHEIAEVEGPGETGLGLGAAEKEGYLGVCYTRRIESTVVFRLLGPDGRPYSRENVLATRPDRRTVPSCSVAFNGEAWAVAWWVAGSADNIVNVQLLEATP